MKVGFIGLGKLGLPCALAINHKGHQVWGYDVNPIIEDVLITRYLPYYEKGADELMNTHTINYGTMEDVVTNSDIIFVPIQTPHEYIYEGCTRIPTERADFDYSLLKNGVENLNKIISEQQIKKVVVIISTVLPGTIEREIKPIITNNEYFKLCYNPFFIAMGTTIDDFLSPEYVLFGVDDEWASSVAEEFYKTIHNKPFYKTDIINAELIKVAYNTYIGMKISYANTIMEMCHKIGANVDEVMGAIKMSNDRLISPKYLTGGMGDGGGCHPRDNIAMSWLANKLDLSHNLFEDIMACREDQTGFLIDLMLEHPSPYYILGKTFKENTSLTLGSPSTLLYNMLKERGHDSVHYDPWVDDVDESDVPFVKGTYIVTSKHDIFKHFDFPDGSVVIDVWRYLDLAKNVKHIKVGNS